MDDIDLARLLHEKTSSLQIIREEKINSFRAVQQCLVEIKRCRDRKLSWDEIAELVKSVVQEGYDVSLNLTGETTRCYYYRLKRSKKLSCHPSQKRKPTGSSRSKPPKDKKSKHHREDVIPWVAEAKNAEPLEQFNHSTSELEEKVDDVAPQKRARNSGKRQPQKTRFNQSSRPGAKPIKIL